MDSRNGVSKKKKAVAACIKEDDNGGAMVVAVRIRPLSSKEVSAGQKSCCTAINGNTIAIKKEGNGSYLKSQQGSVNEYCFDSVFDTSNTQYDVYEKTTKRFIADVVDGYNVTVFAYGATGKKQDITILYTSMEISKFFITSFNCAFILLVRMYVCMYICQSGAGKTHTMMGNTRVDESQGHSIEAGIIPNAMSDIFKIIAAKRATALPGQSWTVIVSFMEVYNEQVYDLLESTDKILSVREDTERGVVEVAGRTKKEVNSAEDVLDLLQLGNTNRKTEATMANQVSSRSHAVLQLAVESNFRNCNGQEISTSSTLSMIDLAGSERASATNNRGSRLQEGANINKSLLALANCINALAGNSASGKQLNVKYRDSKLTHLLKSSLQGKCKLVMIANINPSHITFEDSHNSLKYANRAKNIKVNPLIVSEVNKDSNWIEREMKLKAENAELRARIVELEATVASLQSVNAMLPADFDLTEQDDVIDCSMDCSLLNTSAAANANVSLPVINDIPAIKSSKTPQFPSSTSKKTTPFSDRQRKLCQESRDELVDFVESNCSLTNRSFSSEQEVEKMLNVASARQRNMEKVSKKRPVMEQKDTSSAAAASQNKKLKLEPMTSSLKDRIAKLSKITLEQQKMFDNLLQDQNFVDQLDKQPDEVSQSCDSANMPRNQNQDSSSSSGILDDSACVDVSDDQLDTNASVVLGGVHQLQEPLSVSEKISRPLIQEDNRNMKEVVSLVDIVIEEMPPSSPSSSSSRTAATSSAPPFIFCDEDAIEEEVPTENVPRKRRRNSLIPKPKTETEKKKPLSEQAPLQLRNVNTNTNTNNTDGGGLLSKVMKKMPLTRASKRRMSLAGSENQPVAVKTEKEEAAAAGRPRRMSTRRSSTSVASHRVLRNL
jgi:hypothetical protein